MKARTKFLLACIVLMAAVSAPIWLPLFQRDKDKKPKKKPDRTDVTWRQTGIGDSGWSPW